MGRLIDADELKKNIAKWLKPSSPDEREMVTVDDIAISVMIEIEEQPTAYDVDKVIEQLEDYGKYKSLLRITDNPANCDNYVPVREVKKIVKGGGQG